MWSLLLFKGGSGGDSMRKRVERLIKEHLKDLEELKKRLPEKYHPLEGITEIHYGFAAHKTITAKEIEDYKVEEVTV